MMHPLQIVSAANSPIQAVGRFSVIAILAGMLFAFCLWPGASPAQGDAEVSAVPNAPVDIRLQLIGSLASSHIYTTYGYIGVVEDNVRREIYPPQRVDDLMKEVVVLTDSVLAQMDALLKTELTDEDEKTVREIIEIYGLLKQSANGLRTFATEKTEPNERIYLKLRSDGWNRVAKLLGIPVEEPASK